MSEPAVSVVNLVKTYGDTKAVDNISFSVSAGEVFAILGPNGAGKTTTVEVMECVRRPTSGRVTVLGHPVEDRAHLGDLKRRIGVLPQGFGALGRLTVQENLEFFAGLFDKPRSVADLMQLLEVADFRRTRFSDLSGGLKQRVGVAAALVNDPELVFLDEPTTGLDPEARRATWGVIRDLKKEGRTVVLTTHYMEEAGALADRIAILVKGTLAALDSPTALLRQHGGGRSMVFHKADQGVFGTLRRFFETVSLEGEDVVVPFNDTRDIQVALSALAERGLQVDMSIRSATIEDVFLKLAGFHISDSGEAK